MSIQPESLATPPESAEIAKRLRMHMGDLKISRSKLALATGISRTPLSNKLDGLVEFTVGELAAICHALDKSWLWLTLGIENDENPRPSGPDGGQSAPSRARTEDLRIIRSDALLDLAEAS